MIKIRIEKDPELDQPDDEICCKILRTVLEDQDIDDGTIKYDNPNSTKKISEISSIIFQLSNTGFL